MQGLVVVGLIFEEIPNINIKCVKVTGMHNIGQGHQVKVPVESVHREEVLYKQGSRGRRILRPGTHKSGSGLLKIPKAESAGRMFFPRGTTTNYGRII